MLWLVTLIGAVLQVLQVPAAPQVSAASVRFHHLHYRVSDPLASMREAAGVGGGEPTILQGLGVGVAIGAEYVLFDRIGDEPASSASEAVGAAYPTIVEWFRSHGIEVPSDGGRAVALSARVSVGRLDHVAFATSNLPDALAHLARAGVRVTTRNDESVMVDRTIGGVRVEIVRDPDLPDRFWCPMHPDVRAAVAGTCPICRMTLVPIPPPQIGEFRMDVDQIAGRQGRGISGLRLRISAPGTYPSAVASVRDTWMTSAGPAFLTVHDKRLHLFVVGRSLDYFAHAHPDQMPDGSFELRQEVPPGEYMLMADFLPAGGTAQMVQRAIVTPGYDPPAAVSSAVPVPVSSAVADGVRVTVEASSLAPGRTGTIRFAVADARTGRPVTDLEPYLSAPAHALLVSADLTFAVHGHPREGNTFGAVLSFEFLAPSAGLYKMWLQVQRRGRVITLPFVFEVG